MNANHIVTILLHDLFWDSFMKVAEFVSGYAGFRVHDSSKV